MSYEPNETHDTDDELAQDCPCADELTRLREDLEHTELLLREMTTERDLLSIACSNWQELFNNTQDALNTIAADRDRIRAELRIAEQDRETLAGDAEAGDVHRVTLEDLAQGFAQVLGQPRGARPAQVVIRSGLDVLEASLGRGPVSA